MPNIGPCVLEFVDSRGKKARMDTHYELQYAPDIADRRVTGVLKLALQDGIRAQLAGRGEIVFGANARAKVVFVSYSKGHLEFANEGPFPSL